MTRIFAYSVDSSDSGSFSLTQICVLLEVLKNTNCPNNTNLCLFGREWFVFVFLWLDSGSTWITRNTNYPNNTNLCLFGWEWFVFVFLRLDLCSAYWILRNTNYPNDTNFCLFGWFEWFGVDFLRLDSGSFYFVVIWKKRVRRLPRLRSILSI